MRGWLRTLAAAAAAAALAVAVLAVRDSFGDGDDGDPTSPAAWTVVSVVDGDTVDVRRGDVEERVRVIGIDTPERGECGFAEATALMEQLVGGREVELVPGARDDRDRYGRLLRYVDVDGTDAGREVIDSGLAVARYDSRDGYGAHPREDAYVTADEAADLPVSALAGPACPG